MKLLGLTISFLLLLTSCKDTNKESFDLNSFPNDWVRLTDKDGKLVVFNSCDGGNLLLTISKNSDHFELLLHGQQEDYGFEILETTQISETIFLKAKWKDSDEKQDFKFIWTDKEKGLGRFITTYSNGFTSDNLFVTSDKQNNFEKFDQPCRECWGDECDDIKSNKELMQGLWIDDQDSLASVMINDSQWTFNYKDEQANSDDNYSISITDRLPEFVKETENGEFLILTNKSDTLKFEILGLTDSTFSMMYYPAGKIHLYRRQ
jgi:hypothetical protein